MISTRLSSAPRPVATHASLQQSTADSASSHLPDALRDGSSSGSDSASPELQKAFQDFVGQTFYGQLIKSMRQTVGEPAYFHGGRTEEVFQSQMDQIFAEKMSDATAEQFSKPMFDLFTLPRS